MKPLAIVTTHPIQYQVPLYRYLHEIGIPIHVFFLSERGLHETFDPNFGHKLAWDIPLLEGFPHTFLKNLRGGDRVEKVTGLINPQLLSVLRRRRFEAVLVHGYRNISMMSAIATARLARLPILYRSESTVFTSRLARRPTAARFLRRTMSGFLSIGTLNDQFYASIGVPRQRRFLVPYSVDNDRFQQRSLETDRTKERARLGFPSDSVVFLFAGKLVSWKRPDLLLRAFSQLEDARRHLAFMGDGVMRSELEHAAQTSSPGSVSFLGFRNQDEAPSVYAAADVLVLPSDHEPWGLVVNEGMNAGLPQVVSDRVGSAADLVTNETGFVFPAGDEATLVAAMESLTRDDKLRARMGEGARHRISQWGYPLCAKGLKDALSFVSPLR